MLVPTSWKILSLGSCDELIRQWLIILIDKVGKGFANISRGRIAHLWCVDFINHVVLPSGTGHIKPLRRV